MKKKNKKKGNSLIQKLLIFLVILVVAIVLFLQRRYFLFFSVLAISFISFIFFLTVKSFNKEKSLFSKRKAILIMIIFVCFLIYVLRLIKIQFFDVEKYTNLMNKQLLSTDKEIGQRGIIYDSNGKKMAFNKRLYTLIVDPSLLNDDKVRDNLLKDITAIKESGIIELNPNVEEEIKDLAEKNIRYKVLLKNIDDEKKEKIDALLTELHKETNGKKKKYRTHLIFEKLIDRVYFQKKEYEKLIGIYGMTENSNSQKIGVSGLEKGYEKYLVERRRAISKLYGLNKKNTLALSKDVLYLNLDGKDLHLTINTNLNYILNEEIKTQFEATNAYEAAKVLQEIVDNYSLENLVKKSEVVHQLEKENDEIVRKILNELYISFITPIDREDIVDITDHLDNIIDSINSLSYLLDHLVVEAMIAPALELTAYIVKATEGVKSATKEFAKFKNSKTLVSLIDEVNTIESQGDKLYSSAMKDLMTNEKDLLKVIKWKDVYDQLERTINDCESAVNIIVGIVIKNT